MSLDVGILVVPELHDVAIIGAGPCGLAVAARLNERMPAATFTDEEHQRYHWIKKHTGKMSIKQRKTGAVVSAVAACDAKGGQKPNVVTFDASGSHWLANWDRLFETFDIPHLRSPMFFHIDPAERDGLLAFAHYNGRGNELKELKGCVGKELSKHKVKKSQKQRRQPLGEPTIDERDRNDYFVPSTPLFSDHCGCLIDRYGLQNGIVRHEKVQDIRYDYFDQVCQTDKIFEIRTNRGVYYARTAVLAVGPANPPTIPDGPGDQHDDAVTHAMQIRDYPSLRVQRKITAKTPTYLLIVGGGLTSAQLADLAIRRGVSHVWLIMRGPLKQKYFDVDLEWVGKFRNHQQAAFWTADTDEERLDYIKAARNGGSITPPYVKILERLIKSGKVTLCRYTTIRSSIWDAASEAWHIGLAGEGCDQKLPPIDHIYYATGIQSDFKRLPYLQELLAQYPIKECGGLPCLTEDMQWRDDVPLFVAGRLAGLQLGPGAPNLVGARIGAERIAWSIQDILGKVKGDDSADYRDEKFNYLTGRGNMFDALDIGV